MKIYCCLMQGFKNGKTTDGDGFYDYFSTDKKESAKDAVCGFIQRTMRGDPHEEWTVCGLDIPDDEIQKMAENEEKSVSDFSLEKIYRWWDAETCSDPDFSVCSMHPEKACTLHGFKTVLEIHDREIRGDLENEFLAYTGGSERWEADLAIL